MGAAVAVGPCAEATSASARAAVTALARPTFNAVTLETAAFAAARPAASRPAIAQAITAVAAPHATANFAESQPR